MAISVISTVANAVDGGTQITFSNVNLSNGSNRACFVSIGMGRGAVSGGTPTCIIGGTESLTYLGQIQVPTSGQGILAWGKIGITSTGVKNIVANSAPIFPSSTIQGSARVFSNVLSSRTQYTANGTGSTPTVTVVDSIYGDVVIDMALAANNSSSTAATLAEGAGQTEQSDTTIASSSNEARLATSYEVPSGANTVMSWTAGYSTRWSIRAFALEPTYGNTQIIFAI